ncbi:MAG TPA: PHP domain-containing protein [Candidatus Elarobacter sp.]|nr:PHP domain-containing protein [Candidatus Elarobacter sp.]
MDPRRAAHTLSRIGGLLELSGVDRFRARAYGGAADAIRGLAVDDITPLYHAGDLAKLPGVGPATLSVIGELVETGESSYLARLLESVPEGLIDVARVPGLTPAKAALLHHEIGVASLDDLEAAARDGRLLTVKGFGDKTVRRVLHGIEVARGRSGRMLFRAAAEEAERAAAQLAMHPHVTRVEPAGEVRRIADVVRDVVLVAECAAAPMRVCAELASGTGVIESEERANGTFLRFVDDTELLVSCTDARAFSMALWRATGSDAHVEAMEARAISLGLALERDGVRTADGAVRHLASEHELYDLLRMDYVPAELREGLGEVAAAARHALPLLIRRDDVRGILHCHSEYSDGSVPIAEMAAAARERGWSYIGISDHSQAAFYAGGLKPDAIARQHDEIDRLNAQATDGFRILKGIECDILGDGQLDYDDAIRDRFDYVIGSIHSRFSMELEAMTARILRAMDDPHLTILAHPTGRLLLQREPYAVDLDAVIEKAAAMGVCVELNADPARLDLDWRWCRKAKERGARIEIGPDAHSPRGLDHTWFGVSLARKAWLTAGDVLNTRTAEDVLAIARARR